ncbi:MAG: Ferric transporter ATP-binding subunit [Dehalococcoidia bacterium]|nr:Ferric transporter ATP-binding subunit [Dehalococcoidia bacterium]
MHLLIILLVSLVIITGCTPKTSAPLSPASTPTQSLAATPSPAAPAVTKETSNWDKVVDAAKKEGEVTIYSFNYTGDIGTALALAFKNKFGITLNIITGRGAEFAERIKTEKRVGQMVGDVTEGSITNILTLKDTGLTIPLSDLPIFRDGSEWQVDPRTNDADAHVLGTFQIVYSPWINTRLLTPQQVPASFKDLLKPEWKGKIIGHDAVVSSAAYNYFVPLTNAGVLDWDYVKALGRQQLNLVVGGPQAAQSLARGEYPIILMNTDTNGARFVSEGAPIKAVSFQEGDVAQLGGEVVIKGSPHPNAAKVLANWLLLDEAQRIIGEKQGIAMVRKGVPDFRPANAQAPSTKKTIAKTKDYDDMARMMRDRYIPDLWKN